MTSSVLEEYQNLLGDHTEDEILCWAVEESRKHFDQVETPRLTQAGSETLSSRTEISSYDTKSDTRKRQVNTGKETGSITCALKGMDDNGFDLESGRKWIYPTNYPVRDYQFNIVEQALFKNTLVSLPTGLGKTFIAAVVMYNFYRWYPQGKILFLAPTRPLVAQQIESCYKVMGIPKEDATEMTEQLSQKFLDADSLPYSASHNGRVTDVSLLALGRPPEVGHTSAKDREVLWKRCRLFFLTPQSLLSDLMRSTCPVHNIRCIVVDEAHKATGNYAYCQVIRAIIPFNRHFRVLALSATPGSDMTAVQQVVQNLLIEHIEVRDEQSSDTAGFTNQRIVETIVVKLEGFHKDIQERYYSILDVYTKQLVKLKLIYTSIKTTSKYALILARKKFRDSPPPGLGHAACSQVESDFAVCMSLYHGLELLSQHGLRNLLLYLTGLMEESDGAQSFIRARLRNCTALNNLIEDLRDKLGGTELREPDPDQSINEVQTQTVRVCSHPKMEKLRDVVRHHFLTWQKRNEETRVMVFCQYRDTVIEACHILSELRPLVKVMSFVGQASGKMRKGFSQKQQLRVMTKFRQGGYNTLVSTCVGEEGLDIGEVDLIVCYEAHASPVRLVQRMGRTGRQRKGQIVMLLTEGKETKKYYQSMSNRKTMNCGLVNSHSVLKLEANSPRMVPKGLEPECYKMHMVIPKPVHQGRHRDVRKMFADKINSKAKVSAAVSPNEDEEDVTDPQMLTFSLLQEPEFLHALGPAALKAALSSAAAAQSAELPLDLEQALQEGSPLLVSRSPAAELLVQLLHTAGSKRCNMPQTQTAGLASQLCRKDLWPQKKRRKGSLESRGPQKKKRKLKQNANAVDTAPKPGQRRLTSLWSSVGQSDSELMPPPPALPLVPAEGVDLEDVWVQDGVGGTEEVDDDVLHCEHDDTEDQLQVSCDKVSSSPTPTQERQAAALDKDWSLIEQLESGLDQLETSQPSASCPMKCSQLVSLVTTSPISSHRGVLSRLKGITDNLRDVDELSSLFSATILESVVSQRQSNKFCVQGIALDPAVGHLLDDMDFNFSCHGEITEEKTDVNFEDRERFSKEIHTNQFLEKEFDLGLTQLLAPSPESNESSLLSTNCDQLAVLALQESSPGEASKRPPLKAETEDTVKGGKQDHSAIQVTSRASTSKEANLFSGDISDFIDEAMLRWLQSPVKAGSGKDGGEDMAAGQESTSGGSPILGSQKDRSCTRALCRNEIRMTISSSKPPSQGGKKVLPTLHDAEVSRASEVIDILKTEEKAETSKGLVSERKEWTLNESCISPILGSQTKQGEPTWPAVNRQLNTISNISTPKVCRRNLNLGFSAQRRENKKIPNTSSECKPSLETEVKLNNNESSLIKDITAYEPAHLSDNETSSLEDFVLEQPAGCLPNTKRKKQSMKEDQKKIYKSKGGKMKGQIYFEKEAEESFEDRRVSSDGENTSGLDEYDSSFVDDEEEKSSFQAQDSVDIQAQYLQSVKSPFKQPGQFKIKPLDNVPVDVYSQALTAEELNESYEEDSFCVDGSSEEHSQEEMEQDTLDVLEAALKYRRKRHSSSESGKSVCLKENHYSKEKPKDRPSSSKNGKKDRQACKRRRIRTVSYSSDEERPILEPSQVYHSRNKDPPPDGKLAKNILIIKSPMNCNEEHFRKDTRAAAKGDMSRSEINDFMHSISKTNLEKNEKQQIKEDDMCNLGKSNVDNRYNTCVGLKAEGASPCVRNLDAQSIGRTSDGKTNTGEDTTSGVGSSKINSLIQPYKPAARQHEMALAVSDKFVVIASSRHVSSGPEIVTALKSKYKMVVVVRAIRTVHYIISRHVAVIRVSFSDLCRPSSWTSLQELVQEMRSSFRCPYVLVEAPALADKNSRIWPAHASDHSASLHTVLHAHVLYSTGCDLSASLIAKLCLKEKTQGRGIMMPVSLKLVETMLQFLEALPGVNTALALDIIFKYRNITSFLNTCSSVGTIQEALGISREAARELFFLLSDVCV